MSKKSTYLLWLGMIGYVLLISIQVAFLLFVMLTTVVLALAMCMWLAI